MDRLTVKNSDTDITELYCGYEDCDASENECPRCIMENFECYAMKDALEKLAQYQGTELTPEQIPEMSRMFREKCEEVNQLKNRIKQLEFGYNLSSACVDKLTKRNEELSDRVVESENLIKEDNTSLTGLELAQIYATLSYFKKLKEDGRMIEFACKIGDIIYEPTVRGTISTYKVTSSIVTTGSRYYTWELIEGYYSDLNGFNEYAIGKSVFITPEEAEKALKQKDQPEHREQFMNRFMKQE